MGRALSLLEDENRRLRSIMGAMQDRLMESESDRKDLKHAVEKLALGAMRIPRMPEVNGAILTPDFTLPDEPFLEPWEPLRLALTVEMSFHWEMLKDNVPWVYHELLSHMAPLLEQKIIEKLGESKG